MKLREIEMAFTDADVQGAMKQLIDPNTKKIL